jgi:large subunit ribosomal protein L32
MGAIGPKGKVSKGRRDKRRASNWKIAVSTLTKCPKCGKLMRAHRVCKSCGSYNKREIFAVEDK